MARFGFKKAKAEKQEQKKDASVADKVVSTADYALLSSPVITEKTSLLGQEKKVAVFKVRKDADKEAIKRAVEKVFNVQVHSGRQAQSPAAVKFCPGS